MPKQPYDTPTKADAIDGEVTLDGPDGVGLSMTPEAAKESARRMIDAARVAIGQQSANEDSDDGEHAGENKQ